MSADNRAALGAACLSLAAAALIAIACRGGDGEPSLEEYFRGIDGIGDQATLRFGERAVEPPAADASEEELAEYARATLRESAAILREARDSFDELKPPSEVDLALSVLNSPEFTAADQRFTDACVSLQKKADDNNIDVNLGCEQ